MISPSPTVTLFTHRIDAGRRAGTLIASTAIHAVVIALVSLGILYAPATVQVATDHYLVRRLDLHAAQQPRAQAAKDASSQAAEQVVQQVANAMAGTEAPNPAAMPHLTVHAPRGPQTLLQPDLAVRLVQPEVVPVPQVLLWSRRNAITKILVAPRPVPLKSTAEKPSLDAPNRELAAADVSLAASRLPSEKLHLLPSTTIPLAAKRTSPVQSPPASVTQSAQTPTPAAILSLSDLHMNDGSAMLPPLNETANFDAPNSVARGIGKDAGAQGQGASAGAARASASSTATKARANLPREATSGVPSGAVAGAGAGDDAGTTEITLPKTGQFGAVVAGESLDDRFPELADVWGGRMAYTVYLHVGLARSWILQYALPLSADAAEGGNIARMEAPWPYTIVRPNLAPGSINADAVLVHGFVDATGHFDRLSVVFPRDLSQARFVVQSLEQWQFRPASQNGHAARVEVVLIIPEELE